MSAVSPALLIATVAAVGILHTMVPDHWAPIALLARQHGWPRKTAAKTAAIAGVGHTLSTLAIAIVVWIAGIALAQRFGNALTVASSTALVAFGAWIAVSSIRELRSEHGHAHFGHTHWHRHGEGVHRHWHQHHAEDWHAVEGSLALAAQPDPQIAPQHEHEHARASRRTALLLILGSSPMVEGIPAFFAAAKYGAAQLAIMSVVFAVTTIGTYVALVLLSAGGLERISLGPFERYGEVLSGLFVALVGVVFFFV
jgi:hypothetical protein